MLNGKASEQSLEEVVLLRLEGALEHRKNSEESIAHRVGSKVQPEDSRREVDVHSAQHR